MVELDECAIIEPWAQAVEDSVVVVVVVVELLIPCSEISFVERGRNRATTLTLLFIICSPLMLLLLRLEGAVRMVRGA